MADVALSAAVRQSLLSLQSTTNLIDRTQNRLSTGLKVAGPIDDPVAFFQAKSLDDRSFDFTEKKDGIDQGVSIVTAALDGVEAVENIVRQLKGLANSLKSASGTQFTDLLTQFNDLRNQINYLTTDATYQGTNLINGTGETLSVEFSDLSQSKLDITSVDLTNASQGLSVGDLNVHTGNFIVSYATSTATTAGTGEYLSGSGAGVTLTWEGAQTTYTSGTNISFSYGTGTYTIVVGSGGDRTLNNGDTFTVDVATGGQTGFYIVGNTWTDSGDFAATYTNGTASARLLSGDNLTVTYHGVNQTITTANDDITVHLGTDTAFSIFVQSGQSVNLINGCSYLINLGATGAGTGSSTGFYVATGFGTAGFVTNASTGSFNNFASLSAGGLAIAAPSISTAQIQYSNYVAEADTTAINSVITELDAALSTLRTQGSSLGSNVALLQTRLDFTEQYVNTLEDGSGKLTLADLNSEGANLLALQTRQSLGIQSLSFAGQAEQSILGLFR